MKSVKVSDEVHDQLLAMQRPRESMSDIIKRLLLVYGDVKGLVKRLYGDNRPPGSYLDGIHL